MEKPITLKSMSDNLKLHGDVYIPEVQPKAVVQIIPSVQDHKERYKKLAAVLCKFGYVVVVVDNRGSGQSISEDIPLGYFADNNGWLVNLRDINRVSLLIREKFRKLPYYIIGNSYGSLIAHSYLKRYEEIIDGIIFIGMPAYHKQAVSSKTIASTIAKIKGGKAPAKTLINYNSALSNVRTPFDYLSYNVDNVDEYIADKLCGYNMTNRGNLDLIEGMQDVFTANDWRALKKKMPILYMVGQDDVCADVGSGFKNTLNNLSKAGYECIEANIYENMRHDILNEREMKFVLSDLLKWLKTQNDAVKK